MGKVIALDQRSNSWLAFRGKGIGSSDAAAVLGVSPWKTAFQLWEEKTGKTKKEFTPNWAMERGNQLEPKARAAYELLHDADMPPVCMTHDKYEFMRGSFDGHNCELSRDLEIKCPGDKDHEEALAGSVPEKYIPQCQHLLMVSGSKELHYFSYHPDFPQGKRSALVIVKPDLEFQGKLLNAEIEFWEKVQSEIMPELTKKDFQELDSPEHIALFNKLRLAKIKSDEAHAAYEEIKKLIIDAIEYARVRCAGVQMIRATRKGSIEYSKIPELQGVDLEKFRKKPTSFVEFRIQKESA